MNRVLITAALAATSVLAISAGCEEKKVDNTTDKVKQSVGQAGDAMKQAANDAAAKAKEVAASANDHLKAEVQDLMTAVQHKVDALDHAGEQLKADAKPEFDKSMNSLRTTWSELSKQWDTVKTQSGEALTKGLADLKTKGLELMDKVKATASKFNLNLG